MTKHIGVMIAWIVVVGLLLYVVQHTDDLLRGIAYMTKGGNLKELFQSIDTLFK
jgi:hypothetical protein